MPLPTSVRPACWPWPRSPVSGVRRLRPNGLRADRGCRGRSVGRIYDGHVNAIERLAVQGSAALAARDLPLAVQGDLWAGVWGGDPSPERGPRRRSSRPRGDRSCAASRRSARAPAGCTGRWCSRAPERARGPARARLGRSHRCRPGGDRPRLVPLPRPARLRVSPGRIRRPPVLELFGEPGAISAQPWFGRDALRTAASWAGMADSAVAGALRSWPRGRPRGSLRSWPPGASWPRGTRSRSGSPMRRGPWTRPASGCPPWP